MRKQPRSIAKQGLARFGNSVGGPVVTTLQIEARSSLVSTQRVWNQPLPTIDARYRNVTKIYLRAVKFDFEDFVKSNRWHSRLFNGDELVTELKGDTGEIANPQPGIHALIAVATLADAIAKNRQTTRKDFVVCEVFEQSSNHLCRIRGDCSNILVNLDTTQ
jgi:hypothetical protein